jgi:hypothetical protein
MRYTVLLVFVLFCSVSGISQTEEDRRKVLQLCLDINQFQSFYHPEIEGRVPVVILDNGVVPETKNLVKFDEEVFFWSKGEMFFHGKRVWLTFEEFILKETTAEVHFSYEVEGAEARISLEKKEGVWITTSVEVGEY